MSDRHHRVVSSHGLPRGSSGRTRWRVVAVFALGCLRSWAPSWFQCCVVAGVVLLDGHLIQCRSFVMLVLRSVLSDRDLRACEVVESSRGGHTRTSGRRYTVALPQDWDQRRRVASDHSLSECAHFTRKRNADTDTSQITDTARRDCSADVCSLHRTLHRR